MKVSETSLLESGFSNDELQKIKNNVERFGGTLEEAINDLARRFSALLTFTGAFIVIFLLLAVFSTPEKTLAGGGAFVIGIVIMSFAQPLVISFKSWRYRKSVKN